MKLEDRLMAEYGHALGLINRLGTTTVVIKGWCVTAVAGALALKAGGGGLFVYGILAFLVLVFWFLDASYRAVMEHFKHRCREIEGYFERPGPKKIYSPALISGMRFDSSLEVLRAAAHHIRVWPLYGLLLFFLLCLSLFAKS